MTYNSITLTDRIFNFNGKQYRYKKEGIRPYNKSAEEFTNEKIKDGEFMKTSTELIEIKPNGEEKVLIRDMTSAYIDNNRGVQKAHGRYYRTSENSVSVVQEVDGRIRRIIRTPEGEKVIYGNKLNLGHGDWLDLSAKKSFQECVQEAREHISEDFIERLKGLLSAEELQRYKDYTNKRLHSLNELGENTYKQLIRIMKKFRI